MASAMEQYCQNLLDIHHPGHRARAVIQNLCPELISPNTAVVEVFSKFMYDCFAQTNLERHQRQQYGLVVTPLGGMLKELIFRLLRRWNRHGFIDRALGVCKLAEEYKTAYGAINEAREACLKTPQLQAMSRQLSAKLDEQNDFSRSIYLLSNLSRTLLGQAGSKTRQLIEPNQPKATGSINFTRLISEDTRLKMKMQDQVISSLPDRELGVRIMHAIQDNDLLRHGIEYPVYGISSIYVMIPWAIERLAYTPMSVDNKLTAQFDQIESKIKAETEDLIRINERFIRVSRSASPEPSQGHCFSR